METMTETRGAAVPQLCDLIGAIERQHRAGITPTFGQVEELFEMARELRGGPMMGADQPPVRWPSGKTPCDAPGCGADAVTDIYGTPFCRLHGDVVSRLVRVLQGYFPSLVLKPAEA